MSIVVWDGQSLAVDRGGTDGATLFELDKCWEIGDAVVTGTGDYGSIAALRDWYTLYVGGRGFPSLLHPAELIVVSANVGLRRFEHTSALPIAHGFNKCAFGSGRDFAYGALAMGATAEQAAEVACRYSTSCGHGVKVFKIL